jgi:endonuclease/exonuclease/phosphatase family metal-dependent hydrolase
MEAQPLRVASVNIEGQRHLKERILPFLKDINPDVALLQEVFYRDLRLFSQTLQMEAVFAPMRVRPLDYLRNDCPMYPWGVAILSGIPITECQALYYDRFSDDLPLGHPDHKDDTETEHDNNAKVLLKAKVEKAGSLFNLATTHFTWTPNGQPSPQQWKTLERIKAFLDQDDRLIFTGDTNAPRGGPIWAKFCETFTDGIPQDVTTTIDGNFHKAGPRPLVVDGLFNRGYRVSNVRVIDGISDHCAVTGEAHSD